MKNTHLIRTKLFFALSFVACLSIFIVQSCSPTTKVVATWKEPTAPAYKSFIVVTMSQDIAVRSEVESRMVARFLDHPEVKAVASSAVFSDFNLQDTSARQQAIATMISEIQKSGYEAIVTFALVRQEEDTRYVPGSTYYSPGYGYYGTYGGYYGYSYPYYSTPGYYTTDKTYYIESNVYDAKSLKLMWSTQSEIFNPTSLKTACNSFTWVMYNALKRDKMLYTAPKQ